MPPRQSISPARVRQASQEALSAVLSAKETETALPARRSQPLWTLAPCDS